MPTPNLGYGQRGEAPINAVNQWMRSTPWYNELIRSFGQDPRNVHLNDAQKQAVVRAAQANGVVVDEGHDGQEVDDSGNFQAKSHKLRNTLIVGGLAAATLLTAGAAGAAWGVGPAWGAAGSAAGASGAAAGAGSGAAAGAGAAGAGAAAGTGAGLAGVEGLGWGVSDAALTGLGTGAMSAGASGAGAAGAGAAAAAGGSAVDGASPWLADGTFAGDSTFSSIGSAGGGSSSLWSRLAMKYGPEAVAGAIKAGLSQNQAEQQLQLQRDKMRQEAALEETRLDPFRGEMAQAHDVGKLDLQAEGNFSSSPVQTDAKYGAGLNVQPEQFYTPSPVMRAVARGARDDIAAGRTMPSMTDPTNYGKTQVFHYDPAAAPAGGGPTASTGGPQITVGDPGSAPDPRSAPATALLAALRQKGLLDDSPTEASPWLA